MRGEENPGIMGVSKKGERVKKNNWERRTGRRGGGNEKGGG